jgi:hypothetical protein
MGIRKSELVIPHASKLQAMSRLPLSEKRERNPALAALETQFELLSSSAAATAVAVSLAGTRAECMRASEREAFTHHALN